MPQVLATFIKKRGCQFKFKTSLWGSQILLAADLHQDWDTNTGRNDGPEYIFWRRATREEAEELIHEKD